MARNQTATFHYRVGDFTPAATATDVLSLNGKTGVTVEVTKMTISGTATAAAIYDLYLTKRIVANTLGTFTNPVPTPSDSVDVAGAMLYLYTANPTIGLGGAALEGDKLYLPASATPASAPSRIEYTWGTRGDQGPILKSPADSVTINFNGQAVPAGTSLYLSIEWIEY